MPDQRDDAPRPWWDGGHPSPQQEREATERWWQTTQARLEGLEYLREAEELTARHSQPPVEEQPIRWETLRALGWLVCKAASAVWDMLCSDLARLRRAYREDRRRKGPQP